MEVKAKLAEWKTKYGTKAIKVVVALVFVVVLVFVGKYYANQKVNEFVKNVKNEWSATVGRALQDNIAKLQQKQEDMEIKFKDDIARIKRNKMDKQQEFKNVLNTKDPKQIAAYFDNTIDHYTPSK